MYKRSTRTSIVVLMLFFLSSTTTSAHHTPDHPTGHWRLPFTGVQAISQGPGENTHINASSEALDYPGTFTVVAPADGYILDVLYANDFGWVVRINHGDLLGGSGTVSFYAHMVASSVSHWQVANPIKQGDVIGTSGQTGTGASGIHLHFEARTGATQGSVYSGQSVPIRAIPGQWWNKWYSPVPNAQSNDQFSGGAKYPESNVLPTVMPIDGNPRHLANFEAPSSIPAAHLSNIVNSSVVFHMGGSPSTLGNSQYQTYFQIGEYITGSGWQYPFGSYTGNSIFGRTVNSSNQCTPNNQHCHIVWSYNSLRGWSDYRTLYFHTGNTTTRQPYIAASYHRNSNVAILTFDSAGATYFLVWEDTPSGNPPTGIYAGSAKSIVVNHQSNRSYTVSAWTAAQGWSPWSIWLVP